MALLAILPGLIFAASALKGAPETAPLSFSLLGEEKFPGQVAVVRADGDFSALTLPARGFGQEAPFYEAAPSGPRFALIAIPLDAKPGLKELQAGQETLSLRVLELPGEEQLIRLPPKASKALSFLASEKGFLVEAMKAEGPPAWKGKFMAPALGRLSTPFGAARLYMPGRHRWHHKGLDWAMEEGRPLAAANAGVVALARHLKAYGGVVVISHGYGLSSTCMHLSEIRVKEGQALKKGEILGLSGSTGIATGPHLHFQMNLRGFPIDPLEWLEAASAGDEIHNKPLGANGGALP